MLVRLQTGKTDQTAFKSSLIRVCTVCLGHFGRKLVFKPLEHLLLDIFFNYQVRIIEVLLHIYQEH